MSDKTTVIMCVVILCGLLLVASVLLVMARNPRRKTFSTRDVYPVDGHPYRSPNSLRPPLVARLMTAVDGQDLVLDPEVPALVKRRAPDEAPTTTPHLEQMRDMLTTYAESTEPARHGAPACAEASSAAHDHGVGATLDHGDHCHADSSGATFDHGGGFDGGGHHH